MKQKIVKTMVYEGLGFPIRLNNVPMIKIRGEWVPHINYNSLQESVLLHLCHKKTPLTGSEIAFIRQYFAMTTTEFGKRFGCSHVAVLKWEKYRNNFARIAPTTEVCIRLFVFLKLSQKAHAFKNLYMEIDIPNLTKCLKDAEKTTILALNVQEDALFAA